jgi:hypothetical protein
MKGNAVALHQGDKVLRRVTCQRRAAEVWVVAQKVALRGAHVQVAVGEVGAPAARDADFFGHFVAVVQHQHLEPALARHPGAEQAGGTGADHDGVKLHAQPFQVNGNLNCFTKPLGT